MAKPIADAIASMITNLEARTGRKLSAWITIARSAGATHGAIVKRLKAEHELTHGYANLVAQRALLARDGGPQDNAGLVAAQYAGARAALRPIHDALLAAVKKFGRDLEIAPKKTCVSLRRARQFALIQPATNTRIDLGLKLAGVPLGGRLEKWPNDMCTHRVRLENVAQVDRQLLGWLERAYGQAD
jgi:hypothetical protein